MIILRAELMRFIIYVDNVQQCMRDLATREICKTIYNYGLM